MNNSELNLLRQKINAGNARLFDIREQDEWDVEHLKAAEFLPLSQIKAGRALEPKENDLPIYLYCRNGNRVMEAVPLLKKMGYTLVTPLEMKFTELVLAGFEMVSGSYTQLELRLQGGCTFEAKNILGVSTIVDGPVSLGGTFSSLRPMETVLAGLAGCSAVDVVLILKKGHHQLDDLQIIVDAERVDEIPAVLKTIHLHFKAMGPLPQLALQRACDLSMEKYCSVTKMLQTTVDITHSCEIVAEI